MRPTHAGNDAKTARMIAALGNFDIGEMPWCKSKSRRSEIGNILRAMGDIEKRRGRGGFWEVIPVPGCVMFLGAFPVFFPLRLICNKVHLLTPGHRLLAPPFFLL